MKYFLYLPDELAAEDQPDLRPHSSGRYKLQADFAVPLLDAAGQGPYTVTVPKGTIIDGASVPRLVWTLTGLTPDGLIRAGSTFHDYVYRERGYVPAELGGCSRGIQVPREDADRIFLVLMLGARMVPWRAKMAYWAVRLFGGRAWRGA